MRSDEITLLVPIKDRELMQALFDAEVKYETPARDGLVFDSGEMHAYIDLIKYLSPFACVGFAPIFPDTFYHLTHYWPAAADIPVASDNPAHYADAIRYNARTPLQGSLLPLTRLVWA